MFILWLLERHREGSSLKGSQSVVSLGRYRVALVPTRPPSLSPAPPSKPDVTRKRVRRENVSARGGEGGAGEVTAGFTHSIRLPDTLVGMCGSQKIPVSNSNPFTWFYAFLTLLFMQSRNIHAFLMDYYKRITSQVSFILLTFSYV